MTTETLLDEVKKEFIKTKSDTKLVAVKYQEATSNLVCVNVTKFLIVCSSSHNELSWATAEMFSMCI